MATPEILTEVRDMFMVTDELQRDTYLVLLGFLRKEFIPFLQKIWI